MKFTAAFTHFNRHELLYQSVMPLVGLVDELLIVDDCSTREQAMYVANNHHDHAKIYYNTTNLGMSRAKAEAISNAENNWVLILDSDNIFGPLFLKAIPKKLDPNTIYCPSFARPDFDYRKFEGVKIDLSNIKDFINLPMFDCHLNTANYVVNKKVYLENYVYNPDIKGNDTIWHAYNHLANGGSFFIVPGMEYFHRVHPGSEWLKNTDYNLKQGIEIKKLILEL